MTRQPYHEYVFDSKKRNFVGKFEEMYQAEDKKIFDSWFQSDLTHLGKQLSIAILSRYNLNAILDIGCGTGSFTHLLKKRNNRVIGADISKTAINKAKAKYRGVEFIAANADEAIEKCAGGGVELIIMMEILSYLKNWKEIVKKASNKAQYLFISLYLPPDPIGFIKSFSELKTEFNKYFRIETELLWNNETIFIMGEKMDAAR